MYTIAYTYTYAYVIYMCTSMCINHQHIHIRVICVDYTAYVICYTTNITSIPAHSMQPIFLLSLVDIHEGAKTSVVSTPSPVISKSHKRKRKPVFDVSTTITSMYDLFLKSLFSEYFAILVLIYTTI